MNTLLANIIKDDYSTYSRTTLERYFRDQLREKQLFRNIGSWWETSKGKGQAPDEIDIVAIYANNRKVLVAEVKRQKKNFKPELFEKKVESIRTKLFFKHQIEAICLTMEDM